MRKDRINKTQVNNKKKRKEKRGLNNKGKGKRINVKNLPTFILIGLILMIIIIAIIYYVFLRYAPEQIITYSGYAIEGQALAENLKNSDISNVKPYLDLVEVQENDLLYKRLNSYYVGEDDKKEIDINYPIYINEGNALLNIGKDTKLITVNYEEVEGYPEFMMTDGVMYNGADLTRADGNKYIFLKSEDEIYTNVGAIKITTATNTYNIKEFSNIYFTENSITYYEMEEDSNVQNWYMKYKRIDDIDNNSKIEVKGETISYKTFLERLGLIDSEENVNNTDKEKTTNEISENTVEKPEQVNEESSANENNNATTGTTEGKEENQESEWQEGMWEKPEVSCTDFEGEVYTIRTNLSVRDRAGVITRGITFEIYLDGRLNRRVQASQAGTLEITNLQPSSEYEIRGIFYYNDENGVEQEEEFYTGKVTTKSIDTLGTLDFSFQNGKIYSNKIELIHLKLNNNINEEVVRGISRVQVEIGDVAYRLTNAQIDELKAGKEITYQTSENLTSNSKIKYEITAFDRYGNELKEKNNTGETITSKQAPTSSIRVTKQDVTEVDLEITLTNKDNVSLENYRYEITNQSGDVVKQGTLGNNGVASNGNKDDLVFTDLDPNGYYQIVIYGDYDLENGEGEHQNSELGRGSFVTRPIASLGYMQVKINDKEVTQNSMKLGVSIDTVQTDARLVAILNKVEVVIYDEGKNIESNSDEENEDRQGTEVKRITLTDEEVEKLKTAEEIELNLEQLTSNTKYRIDVITTVKQGSVEEVVEDKQNIDQVITLKMPAEVQIRNQFVIGTMIDLDMRIEDIDGADLVDKVRIEVRDKDNKLVDLSEMPTNAEWERKTYEDLTPNETYTILVYAPQYNEGSTDATYKADYLLKKIEIVTETGISGKLDLIGLEKTPSGKNLIDVSSKVNWYEKCFNTNYKYGINYDENTRILTLGETSSTNNLNYYNLSKYLGKKVTISFKAKTQDNAHIQIIEKESNDFNNTGYTAYYTINDLTSDWKEYTYTITLNKTGYVGFNINNNTTSVEIKDLQIELGDKKTDYEEFKYDYNANVAITVNDTRNEIVTNDYYIRIYKDNEQIQELRYDELGEENKVENAQKTYNIDQDAIYKIELLVKIADRFYELDSQEFSTAGSRELKGISNINDFLKVQPYGEYIALDDIHLVPFSNKCIFGGNNIRFEGNLDFNGKTLTIDTINRSGYSNSSVFKYLGNDGKIENLVFDIKMNNELETSLNGGLVMTNYGTIRNIQINVTESTENKNSDVYLCAGSNYGVIENFVVNLQVPLYVNTQSGIIVGANRGIVRNGYIFGENIKSLNESTSVASNIGGVVHYNDANGLIENVFSLVNIDSLLNGTKVNGNITRGNYVNGVIRNVYSVGIGENANLKAGPNVYFKNSKSISNNYYFTDEIFMDTLETKGNKLSLWDAQFQNQLINGNGAFVVDELVNEGYYPQLNMPDSMPAQEYIELPEVEDADLPDILSTKVLEQGTDTVKVQFSVNNPSAEQISEIKIENIETVDILSQEYNDGKSIVIAELKNPVICVSSYELISLTTKGAFSSFTRTYDPGERKINVDLYKEIWDVNDWKAITDSPTENYMLMADLNFVNEGNTVRIGTINGIINGNGHMISNIFLTYNTHIITTLNGTLKNLYINNFNQEVTYGGGFISDAQTGSLIDNVHFSNAKIRKTENGGAGVIAQFAKYSTIRNSSGSNIQIVSEGTPSDINIGGLFGQIDNSYIENCYVHSINITDSKGVVSGIGGIAGYGSSSNSIKNCYAEGTINSNNINVGGIIGKFDYGELENCYSKVNISTTNNNVGGIIGSFSNSDTSTISNNLAIGNIYSTTGVDGVNRIIGISVDTVSNNYAYKNQLLNGYINEEEKGATLLDEEEVLDLDLGDSYNYDGKDSGILPKLYNTDGSELLPNQEDIFIVNNKESDANLEIDSIDATKPNTTEAEITVRINNPKEIEITGIEIEDMTVTEIKKNVTQNEITSITVRTTPNRYYDSYKLTGIKYKDTEGKNQTKEVENEIQVQFYKEIYTFEDWQSIEEGTYQNYRLMANIDFSGRNNTKNNITVNRLEAENNIYTLKNIELSYNTANTGFINNVKTSIKNIGFENITLTNTASSGDYFGVIASSNGNLENLSFKDITIDSKGVSYVGVIGGISSGNVKNVDLLGNITVNGNSYVGGFTGSINIGVEATVDNIAAEDVTVSGENTYVGGIIGYQNGKYININNISLSNSQINGKDHTGGLWGYLFGGVLMYASVDETEVSGTDYVGGIFGYCASDSSGGTFLRNYVYINSSNIVGNGNYLGGITGYLTRGSNSYWTVNECNVTNNSVSSLYTGGAVGCGTFTWPYGGQVTNVIVNSHGSMVGGFIGNSASGDTSFGHGYVYGVEVTGRDNVGGGFGRLDYGGVGNVYINAKVKAEGTNAGGAVGYMDNTDMTASRNAINIKNSLIVDTEVEAQSNAGGLIGNIAKEIFRDESFYYNNYIEADVTSENTSTGSLIIGGRPDENSYITNTYVYKYSTLNGDYVYASNDNINDEQYLVRADLEQESTFKNKVGLVSDAAWDYTPLQQGKYPIMKDAYLYKPELQTGVDLPTDPDITIINSLNSIAGNGLDNENDIAVQSIETLPTVSAYPVSVNEINIDFSAVPEKTSFTYYVNGQEKDILALTQKTYTFRYNYQDTIEIRLTNENNKTTSDENENTITITPESVRSEASLVGNNNAYLLGTSLYINGELQQGNYVNVYGGYALDSSGQVVDIATKEIVQDANGITNETSNKNEASQATINDNAETSEGTITTTQDHTYLEQTAKPLHTYDYKGNTIETYGTYSKVNDNIKTQIYNVRSGILSAISNNTDMKIDNNITDNYNNKEYQTILNRSGELVDLKEKLQYPSNFLSSNIKQIVQNQDTEKPEMMVLYNTGKVIVFNYVNGNIVYENNEKADSSLVNYLTRSFANIWNDYEDKYQEYEKSKELETKLAKLPVEEAIKEATNNGLNNSIENTSNNVNNNNINANNTNNSNMNTNVEDENNSSANTTTNIANTDNNYITVYNENTGEYEVYSEDEILNGEEENPVSETEKIKQNGLEGIYGYNAQKEEIKPQANGAIIVVSIIGIAIIALVVLRKIILKNNKKQNK